MTNATAPADQPERAAAVPSASAGGEGALLAPADATFELITSRQNVAPKRLVEPGPDQAQVGRLFAAAAAAPDHEQILPWRFVVVPQAKREQLAEAFALALRDRDPNATEDQLAAAREKAFRAPWLALAIVRLASESDSTIPDVERIVSLGAAVQNMLLCATAMAFGSGLTSGKAMTSERIRTLFGLSTHEQAVCFVNVGTVMKSKPPRERPSPAQFVATL